MCPIGAKNSNKLKKLGFSWISCFWVVFNGFNTFRGSGRLPNTIRVDLETAVARLTLTNIEIPQYSCFWECQCIRNESQNLRFCRGPPQNTFLIFLRSLKKIFSKFKLSNLEIITSTIWNFETLKSLKPWNLWIFETLKSLESLDLWDFETNLHISS